MMQKRKEKVKDIAQIDEVKKLSILYLRISKMCDRHGVLVDVGTLFSKNCRYRYNYDASEYEPGSVML